MVNEDITLNTEKLVTEILEKGEIFNDIEEDLIHSHLFYLTWFYPVQQLSKPL